MDIILPNQGIRKSNTGFIPGNYNPTFVSGPSVEFPSLNNFSPIKLPEVASPTAVLHVADKPVFRFRGAGRRFLNTIRTRWELRPKGEGFLGRYFPT
jgi:hypothetical protein